MGKAAAAGHNPRVSIIGSTAYFEGRVLGSSMQKVQFVVGLICSKQGEQHFGFKTLHSLKSKRHLLCYYCHGDGEEWGSKKKASSHEHDFIRVCRVQGLLPQMAREVLRVEWWKGPLDFYHIPSSTGFQIDGEGHFTGQWGERRSSILKRDIACCLQTLTAGGRLVRISHRDMGTANLALIIQEAINCLRLCICVVVVVLDGVALLDQLSCLYCHAVRHLLGPA